MREAKLLACATTLALLAGCLSNRPFLQDFDPKPASFAGVRSLYSSDHGLNFVILHGMGDFTQDEFWAAKLIVSIMNSLSKEKYSTDEVDGTKTNPNIQIRKYTLVTAIHFNDEKITFLLPIYSGISNQVVFYLKPKPPNVDPQTLNRWFQEQLFNNLLIYAMATINPLMAQDIDSLLWSSLNLSADAPTVVIAESLGSFVFHSFLARTVASYDPKRQGDTQYKNLANVAAIFYLGNQIDFLSICLEATQQAKDNLDKMKGSIERINSDKVDWEHKLQPNRESTPSPSPNYQQLGSIVMEKFNEDFHPGSPIKAVAFTDGADMLSFQVDVSNETGSFINAYVHSVTQAYVWGFSVELKDGPKGSGKPYSSLVNPVDVHTNYNASPEVLEMIMKGYPK